MKTGAVGLYYPGCKWCICTVLINLEGQWSYGNQTKTHFPEKISPFSFSRFSTPVTSFLFAQVAGSFPAINNCFFLYIGLQENNDIQTYMCISGVFRNLTRGNHLGIHFSCHFQKSSNIIYMYSIFFTLNRPISAKKCTSKGGADAGAPKYAPGVHACEIRTFIHCYKRDILCTTYRLRTNASTWLI